jgi:(p)ppGpp synthase/HD superfamily hydrolase
VKDIIKRAKEVAIELHRGQWRRDGVTPYHTHPEQVAASVPDRLKPIAWLHDVLEDTSATRGDLYGYGIPQYVTDAVVVLTRLPGEDYDDYIERVCKNPDAIIVKLADMGHNLSCEPSQNSVRKIGRSIPKLVAALTHTPPQETETHPWAGAPSA